jgi:hypothetical protein
MLPSDERFGLLKEEVSEKKYVVYTVYNHFFFAPTSGSPGGNDKSKFGCVTRETPLDQYAYTKMPLGSISSAFFSFSHAT